MTNIIENPALSNTSINFGIPANPRSNSNNHPEAIPQRLALDCKKNLTHFRPKLEQAKQRAKRCLSFTEARPLLRLYAQIAQVASIALASKLSKGLWKTFCSSASRFPSGRVYLVCSCSPRGRRGAPNLMKAVISIQTPGCLAFTPYSSS